MACVELEIGDVRGGGIDLGADVRGGRIDLGVDVRGGETDFGVSNLSQVNSRPGPSSSSDDVSSSPIVEKSRQ